MPSSYKAFVKRRVTPSYDLGDNLFYEMITYIVIPSLDHLQEQSWSVLHIFGEDLEKVSIFVVIYKNFKLLQYIEVFRNSDTTVLQLFSQKVIVAVRDLKKLYTTWFEMLDLEEKNY